MKLLPLGGLLVLFSAVVFAQPAPRTVGALIHAGTLRAVPAAGPAADDRDREVDRSRHCRLSPPDAAPGSTVGSSTCPTAS
jgi:hypothetical protein